MPKTNEQRAYEADLALIAETEAEIREAEERKRKLEEAQERVAEYERKKEIEDGAKKRAETFLKDVLATNWTEQDQQTLESFKATAAKYRHLLELLDVAAHGDFWAGVPKEYAKKLREAASKACSVGMVNPVMVLNKAAESMEVE